MHLQQFLCSCLNVLNTSIASGLQTAINASERFSLIDHFKFGHVQWLVGRCDISRIYVITSFLYSTYNFGCSTFQPLKFSAVTTTLESTNVFGLPTASTSTASNMNVMLGGANGLSAASAVSAATLDSSALYQAQAASISQVQLISLCSTT